VSLKKRRIWIEGELRPWHEATVHLLSQSLQRGSLVFDFMSVTPGPSGPCILGLREHVDRFLGSVQLNAMALAADRDDILEGVRASVRANPDADVVKVSAYYPGVSLDVLPVDDRASLAIAAFARRDVDPHWDRSARPAALQIADAPTIPPEILSPQLKVAASYTHAAVAKRRARAAGFDDVLFLDAGGCLAESSTQSFFLVLEGALCTAPELTVLAGITRRAVLELAADEGVAVREVRLPRAELARASEAFLTGTSAGIWPVGRIDARELPAPVPGPVTERVRARFERMVAGEDPRFSSRWMQPV
jgi:branched-chain amino acid aminotransferase